MGLSSYLKLWFLPFVRSLNNTFWIQFIVNAAGKELCINKISIYVFPNGYTQCPSWRVQFTISDLLVFAWRLPYPSCWLICGYGMCPIQVGNRIIKKRIHVRVEHVQPSRCTEEFRLRKLKNDELKAEAKKNGGQIISTKRQPEGPKPGFMVEGATLETVTPIPYDVVNDLKGGY